MKKLFLGVVAIAAMIGCAKEQIVKSQAPAAISFENAFVQGNSSKPVRAAVDPSFTTDAENAIDAFDVWGFMGENTGVVFEAERVTKNTEGKWVYANLAYWAPSKHYYFAALAPVDHSNVVVKLADNEKYMKAEGLGTVEFTNLDGTDDLVYAEADVLTEPTIAAQPAPVKLTFKHLLSKVKFTFKNGFSNPNNYLEVKNIEMVVPNFGTIDLTQKPFAWVVKEGEKTVALKFGDITGEAGNTKIAVVANEAKGGECADERLTIPVATTPTLKAVYEITFDVVLYQGTEVAYEGKKKTVIEGVTLEPGKAYNFTATLNHKNVGGEELYPIEFTVEVDKWVDGNILDGGVIDTETVK